ncbi:hypothetical protein [Candidatus Mycolicibacterium alkanivorans]|uniref:WXG100 family type VII secretion target n=1 Tax=Candidatus Mycolicibacterium alkanivorans TaxID=2954114 RepID=A0ABS9YRQ4_9MYCO|nr:hypothetical protein [Candidatus Mycolicibacterium alkanivorans]MCI4673519.1 hypothetical protein [Candidatus Mycolicibacterium alkanivorans]
MSRSELSVADVKRWSSHAVREVFDAARERAAAALDVARGLDTLQVFSSWGGDAATAARTSIATTRADLDAHGTEAMAVAHAARDAADRIDGIKLSLQRCEDRATALGLVIDVYTSTVDLGVDPVGGPVDGLLNALALQEELDAILAEADAVDDELATAINMADGDAPIPAVPGPARDAETRLQNQIDAFKKVFDRPPSSAADWETAAALDAHSYNWFNQGVAANIVVGRIKPVPGQGVVRANLFIPSATVNDPAFRELTPQFDSNIGDNRRFDPSATPEQSRVALLVDYENGLVLARQNPSVDVELRQAKAGTPTVGVAQRPDGSLYIRYVAADPFSPGGEGLGKATVAVRGELAVQPGPIMVSVGGTPTAFPALEVYNDRPAAGSAALTTSTVAQMYPWIDNEWGPLAGLWRPTTVGDVGIVDQYYTFIQGRAIPPHTTTLGPVTSPPTVTELR